MPTYSGKAGKVLYGPTPTEMDNVRGWSITSAAIVATGAHSSSGGWTDAYGGMRSWSGTFDYYQDDVTEASSALAPGDEVELVLQDKDAAPGHKYSGNVVIGDMATNDDIEGSELVGGTYSFTGNGELKIEVIA